MKALDCAYVFPNEIQKMIFMKYNRIILISLLLFPLLAIGKVETIAMLGGGMQYLSFHIEPHNATLWVNDEIWELDE